MEKNMNEYDNDIITVNRSFDFDTFNIKESDKSNLYTIERDITENQEQVTKELCEIAKMLYEAREILSEYGSRRGVSRGDAGVQRRGSGRGGAGADVARLGVGKGSGRKAPGGQSRPGQ